MQEPSLETLSYSTLKPRDRRVLRLLFRLVLGAGALTLLASVWLMIWRAEPHQGCGECVSDLTAFTNMQLHFFESWEGRPPDFVRFPDWRDLIRITRRGGVVMNASPENELNHLTNVTVIDGPIVPGAAVPTAGWVYSTLDKRVAPTDASGQAICDFRSLSFLWHHVCCRLGNHYRSNGVIHGTLRLALRDHRDPWWFVLIPAIPVLAIQWAVATAIWRRLRADPLIDQDGTSRADASCSQTYRP